ncbi:Neuroglobin [Taenia solium]|eukprot:TsM_000078500 transcript=TsM_000078500 gene=TsM_000078500
MGCEFSGHHLNTSLGLTQPRTSQATASSSTSNTSSTKGPGSSSSVASRGSFERRGSFLLSSRRALTRQRTTEQVEHAAVVKRQPLNEYFTEFEKDVLISTWEALLLYTNEHGEFIFRLAAEMCPALKTAYNFEFNRNDEMVFSSCALQYSQAYIALIDEAIRSLEDPQEGFYDSILIAGASHAAIPHMKPDYFKAELDDSSITTKTVLKRATLTTWEGLLGEEFTEDVKQAWQTLLDYVVAVMLEGGRVFEEEERRCSLVATGENDDKVEEQPHINRRADVKLSE